MFIVWRQQPLTHDYHRNTGTRLERRSLSAQLSKSQRVDGKPRRVVVCGLGHIEEARLDCPADRAAFWFQAGRGLAAHAGEEFAQLRGKLLERVPEIDPAELQSEEAMMDLLVQDPEAAEFWCRSIEDDELRGRMWRRIQYTRRQQEEHARFQRWWQRQVWAAERRRRADLNAYADEHDIELKPFDYDALDPETRDRLQAAAAAIKSARG